MTAHPGSETPTRTCERRTLARRVERVAGDARGSCRNTANRSSRRWIELARVARCVATPRPTTRVQEQEDKRVRGGRREPTRPSGRARSIIPVTTSSSSRPSSSCPSSSQPSSWQPLGLTSPGQDVQLPEDLFKMLESMIGIRRATPTVVASLAS
jgi:hypothetical protein